jgi:hypothetical protein
MAKPVASYVFDRGETITIALQISAGDPSLVTAVAANLKKMPPANVQLSPASPVIAAFVTAAYPAAGLEPAGWTLSIAAGVSTTLEVGTYITAARVTIAGSVIITDPVSIEIQEAP